MFLDVIVTDVNATINIYREVGSGPFHLADTVVVNSVPEPSTLVLAVLGLPVVFAYARRKRLAQGRR